jgi:hypothetical protein
MMDFIKDLEESRLTRDSNNVRTMTYTDCCERAYLTLLILELLKNFNSFKKTAASYASKTLGKEDYSQFRTFSTDLYNFVYYINGDKDALSKLKDPGAAEKLRIQTTIPLLGLNRYLKGLTGSATQSTRITSDFLIKLEKSLHITNADYKIIRRSILNWNKLTQKEKQDIVTRLLFAARAKLRSSDIIDDLSKLAADKDLETSRVKDPEPKVSVPDLTTDSSNLALYRLLVGTDNLMQTKKFLELARDGRSIPSPMVQGYMPIIKMIDDIVSNGMTSVQLLRNVHQKAKKQR